MIIFCFIKIRSVLLFSQTDYRHVPRLLPNLCQHLPPRADGEGVWSGNRVAGGEEASGGSAEAQTVSSGHCRSPCDVHRIRDGRSHDDHHHLQGKRGRHLNCGCRCAADVPGSTLDRECTPGARSDGPGGDEGDDGSASASGDPCGSRGGGPSCGGSCSP